MIIIVGLMWGAAVLCFAAAAWAWRLAPAPAPSFANGWVPLGLLFAALSQFIPIIVAALHGNGP